ncbi:MAG TPA: hypothetical protein DCX53_12725 [Anaerolineae bacterium]|nr:hypothetical protein [Anaerolineae bacterium]
MFPKKNKKIYLLLCTALLFSACASPAQNEMDIATAVAQTVQAQNSLTEVAALPTRTPVPTFESTATPGVVHTNTPSVASNPGCTLSAELVGENPPDKTLVQPGENFWKTWTFQNTGTCIWDKSYSLVYWDGDLMGGFVSYPLPDVFGTNEVKEISIYLKAPESEGIATGYWRFQSPWGADFGVGSANASFYVQVDVSSDFEYGITSVTYQIVRDPQFGCPTNVRYNVYATITTNGRFKFDYYWDQSDGNRSGTSRLIFTEAGSKTVKRQWMIGKGDSPNPRWMQIIVLDPYREYDQVTILNNCP